MRQMVWGITLTLTATPWSEFCDTGLAPPVQYRFNPDKYTEMKSKEFRLEF